MKQFLIAGMAAAAFYAGAAIAQIPLDNTSSTTTQTTTTTPPAPPASYSETKDQKAVTPDGTVSEKSSSYSADSSGTKASSTEVTASPDGSETSKSVKVQNPAPPPATTTSTSSSSTTTTSGGGGQ